MPRTCLKLLSTVLLLGLIVSCHPEGCYGPQSFGYNTADVVVSNLFGNYVFDGTNSSGSIQLRPDMTFVFSNVPLVMVYPPQNDVYVSTTGKWRTVQTKAVWSVEIYDLDFKSMRGYASLTFPILGEQPPHGLELAINHAEGHYIRYRRSSDAR
jgi:hypothetical protein